mgnify:CR=1 FL=1
MMNYVWTNSDNEAAFPDIPEYVYCWSSMSENSVVNGSYTDETQHGITGLKI